MRHTGHAFLGVADRSEGGLLRCVRELLDGNTESAIVSKTNWVFSGFTGPS
jgi:hypothetical protein